MEVSITSLTCFRTADSITAYWKCTPKDVPSTAKLQYKVVLDEKDSKNPSTAVIQESGTYKFNGLQKGTEYTLSVQVYDGNTLLNSKSIALTTLSNSPISVSGRTSDSISIMWDRPTVGSVKLMPAKYLVRYTEANNIDDPWHEEVSRGALSHTLTGLKPATKYNFCIFAYDESGTLVCQYPQANGYMTESTTSIVQELAPSESGANMFAIVVQQHAKVLMGTDSISMEVEYKYVRRDSNGKVTAHETGVWTHKWSSSSLKSAIVTLPEGCELDGNTVHVVVKSRRAASAGLNKWKVCSEGDVELFDGKLALRLSGDYFKYSVKFTQVK